MAKSLRWRLQLWHACILAGVILGFGSILYLQMRRDMLRDLDTELMAGARVVEAKLLPGPLPDRRFGERPPMGRGPREFDRGPRDFDRGPRDFERGPRGDDRAAETPDGEGRRPISPAGLPPFVDSFELALWLPPSMLYRRGPQDHLPYFSVFGVGGQQIAGSYDDWFGPPIVPRFEHEFRNRGRCRELWLRLVDGRIVMVGRDIGPQLDGLRSLVVPIAFSGATVLGIGLIGGWWLTGRAIAPLTQICETAGSVTAKSLSSRIDTSAMDQELAQLGGILNQMLQRLEVSFEQQTRFVADASHELRTPISVLAMHCELALSRPRSAHEYVRTLETCANASGRMRSLVDDLLTLARADAGQLVSKREEIDLQLIAEESIQQLQPFADQRNITLKAELQSVSCQGDPHQLVRLVNNLLSNAIHYNVESGHVLVQTFEDEQAAVLRVTDTGVGIDAAHLPRLFERFYRVDEARSRQTGGSGLGLAICQSIVAAHGGTMQVSSEKDKGTTMTVRLALQSRLAAAATAPQEASSSQ